ncbi:MarR family winged helix-turn-helix transcriptional regulator [Streptomyces niveiscabiei]|uniref:MarR family winged helix-turn-helix transcriptional regulator n=1 Tax=Streptomyces niveiscabiei TaxID=164115 RepID=A0ABW9HJ78_9ACTN
MAHTSHPEHPEAGDAVDEDLKVLVRLFARVMKRVRDPAQDAPAPLRTLLGDAGLANRHLAPLISLSVDGPASVGELAQRLALSPNTTSQLVNELHRGGLVLRIEDDHDRRRTIVSVGEPHRSLIEHSARLRLAPLRRALDRLAPQDRAAFVRSMRVVAEALETPGA